MPEQPGHYQLAPEIPGLGLQKIEAAERRKALVAGGCSTYIIKSESDILSIQCLCCGLASGKQGDIQNKFCGFCAEFQSERGDR